MKILPCKQCGDAMGPATRRNPNGEPLFMRRAPSEMAYKCHRCKGLYEISIVEFNKLPKLTEERTREVLKGWGESV